MIKMVVTDLDGTLLNSNRGLSSANREALMALQKQDVIVTFASGRPYDAMVGYAKEAKLYQNECYFITNSGAAIFDYHRDQLLLTNNVSVKDYFRIHPYLNDDEVLLAAYTDDKFYRFSECINSVMKRECEILNTDIIQIDPKTTDEEFARICILGTKEMIDRNIKNLPSEFYDDYYIIRNDLEIYEFLDKKAGKANALKELCSRLNLDLETEVLTIGDNMNDYEMLEITGHSVAMGQSADNIKAITKYVTSSNDEDGFAKIVNQIVING